MGRAERQRGNRAERELLEMLRELGIEARRTAASGAQFGHDGDLEFELQGTRTIEVKKRRNGEGFVQLERWLDEHDLLALKRNRAPWMFVVRGEFLVKLLAAAQEHADLMENAKATALDMEKGDE